LAIGAGGVNLFERIFLGLPSIVVLTSENQVKNINGANKRKLIEYLGKYKKIKPINISNKLQFLIDNPKKFQKLANNCYNCIKTNSHRNILKLLNIKNIN
tara:strand:- start:258 stop:557 length:300 start_codon:yes stop_codon:yes gene_type:complete